MCGEDGVGVDEEVEALMAALGDVGEREGSDHLAGGAVVLAQEAGTLAQRDAVEARPGGDEACGVVLQAQQCAALGVGELARLHVLQVGVSVACLVPQLQLTVEEALEREVGLAVALLLPAQVVAAAAGAYLYGAQTILVGVVCILPLDGERGVAVAAPTAAEVELAVDAPDAVAAGEGEAEGVVFAVARVGEAQLAQYGGEEGARSPEAVDAQGVVHAVRIGPFAVVDKSGRQRVEVEVTDAV